MQLSDLTDYEEELHSQTFFDDEKVFSDSTINFNNRKVENKKNTVPEKIYQMQRLYKYGLSDRVDESRNENFYCQGKFMEDYTDNVSWSTGFQQYFPTYHSMNISQLREYFSWRTKFRKGEITQTTTSFAYVYIYELLNQIGTKNAQESFEKLEHFLNNYAETDFGNTVMIRNLKKWILHFSIINNIDKKLSQKYVAEKTIERDFSINILKNTDNQDDNKIFDSLNYFLKQKLKKSIIIKNAGDKCVHLIAEIWKKFSKQMFSDFFGQPTFKIINLFDNAIYYHKKNDTSKMIYELSPVRKYFFKNNQWYEESYEIWSFNTCNFASLFEIIDCKLRTYFHLRPKSKPFPDTNNYSPIIDKAINEYQESLRPKITVDTTTLKQIREDSLETRDNLLTEEDLLDFQEIQPQQNPQSDELEITILKELLKKGDANELIKSKKLMPTIIAEKINEKFYDEFMDNIVDFDGEKLSIIEDYVEDVKSLIFK